MADKTQNPKGTPKEIAAELVSVANVLGGLDTEASCVAKVTHSYKKVTEAAENPQLLVTQLLSYRYLAPAQKEINTALATKLGITSEKLDAELSSGKNTEIVKKANEILNSPEFAKEMEPKLLKPIAQCKALIQKGVEAGFYKSEDGKQYTADFCAIRDAHKSLDGKCPTGCPIAAATDIYNKPAESQAVKGNAK